MKRGFTMIELVFVIVILGILAAVAIPKMVATRTDAEISKLRSDMQTITKEFTQYGIAHAELPVQNNGVNLSVLSGTLAAYEADGKAVNDPDKNKSIIMGCLDLNVTATGGNNPTVWLYVSKENNTSVLCTNMQKAVLGNLDVAKFKVRGASVDY